MAPLCSRTGLVGPVPKGRWLFSWMNCRYGRNLGLLIWTKLEKPVIWMEASQFSSSKESAPYTMCCGDDVHSDVWHWYSTSKTDSKSCLKLCVPTTPPSSSTQEKMTTLGGTELHNFSWQCKKWHCCNRRRLTPLEMGDSGTSTILTQYESMQLQSLCQSEKTTARNLVQHYRWTYPCYIGLPYVRVFLDISSFTGFCPDGFFEFGKMSGFLDKWSFIIILYKFSAVVRFLMFQFLHKATARL